MEKILKTEKKYILEDLFRSVLSQFQKYHLSGSPKSNFDGKNPSNFSSAEFLSKYFGLSLVNFEVKKNK